MGSEEHYRKRIAELEEENAQLRQAAITFGLLAERLNRRVRRASDASAGGHTPAAARAQNSPAEAIAHEPDASAPDRTPGGLGGSDAHSPHHHQKSRNFSKPFA